MARTIVTGFAYSYEIGNYKPLGGAHISAFSDEHSTDQQRLYNALCLGYGGDRQTFKEFVDRGWLPKQRADSCADEFARVKFAFEATILPFIDADLVVKVRQAEWLTPAELKCADIALFAQLERSRLLAWAVQRSEPHLQRQPCFQPPR